MAQRSFFALSFGLVLLMALVLPASAQAPACGPRDVVLERLAQAYGEARRSISLSSDNRVVEVFASSTTGTWTITVTTPAGRTCLVATGHAYEEVEEPLPGPGAAEA